MEEAHTLEWIVGILGEGRKNEEKRKEEPKKKRYM